MCFDGVFNHVTAQHQWVQQALTEGPDSEFAPWFRIDWQATEGPRPEVFEGHESLVALNYDYPPVRDYILRVISHWVRRGVDAWRLDVAYSVAPEVWADVLGRSRLRVAYDAARCALHLRRRRVRLRWP